MICYLDMTFCSAKCATTTCRRNFTEEEAQKARKWWGDSPDGPPVAFSDFSDHCPDYKPASDQLDLEKDALAKVMPQMILFKDMLKGYRADVGLTLEQFGKRIGYSAQYVSDLEKGRRKPSPQFIDQFCSGMEMTASELGIWHRLGAKAAGWRI